jgi:hypothetical protein
MVEGPKTPEYLESKKYHFIADGTMPVLNFEIKSGKASEPDSKQGQERLTLEIYHPMSGEVFEARFGNGRIEVDQDGSVTYFTRSLAQARFSIFLERNVSITIDRSGEVEVRTPSKILSVERNSINSDNMSPQSDSIKLKLE